MSDKPKTKSPYIKSKAGAQLGFRTSDHFKGRNFGGGKAMGAKFNPSTFKTQHKG